MKQYGWRAAGIGLTLMVGVVIGMAFPWSQAQEAASGGGDKKDETAAVKDRPVVKGKTPADLARDRVEIVEEDGHFTLTCYFPYKAHPKRTRWKVVCAAEDIESHGGMRENLVIHYAFFQPSPDVPEIQVLGLTHLAESMVAYSDGVRFYDIAHYSSGLLQANKGDLGAYGFTLDKREKIICEVRNRGLNWKEGRGDHRSRRGEELVLWGTVRCGNYLYVIHFGFHDDGTIQARMGSTGSNLTDHVGSAKSHTHVALWRIDVDFGNRNSNEVFLVRHREPFGRASHSTQVVEPFNGGREGFADWNDKEFTSLRVVNPKMVGKHGRPAAYDLYSIRTGSARHFGDSPDEKFTHHDYYVMKYEEETNGRPAEMDCTKLIDYVRDADSLKGEDVVLWHVTSAHHIPRQEDMFGDGIGATCVVWSGFDLKPRDLFPGTPFLGAATSE